MDVAKLIIHHARSCENDPAIVFAGGIATYGTLARAVLSAGEQLDAAGLARGNIVGIDVGNTFHHLALILALELRGMATASMQNPHAAQQAGLVPAAVLTDGESDHGPAETRSIAVDGRWFVTDPAAPVDFARLLALPGFTSDEALRRVVFSSGTTGTPKSTGLTGKVILSRLGHNMLTMGRHVGAGRLGTMMGLSTLGGYMHPMTALSMGGSICLSSSAPEMLHLMRLFRIDVMLAAVGQLHALLGALGAARPPGIGCLLVYGSKLPAELLAGARERLCSDLMFAYGSTECGMITQAPASLLGLEAGAAGHLLPWVDLEVVDEQDRPLPFGTDGIFRVRTPEQAGYLGEDAEAAAAIRDDWFYPGDMGNRRADGLITVTGRSVEVINRGGSMIAPDLLEQVLAAYPGIIEAAAFGMPGAAGMEDIWAAVVTESEIDERALVAHCRARLADRAPSVIRRVDAIPRTATGKIRRLELRDQLAPTRI